VSDQSPEGVPTQEELLDLADAQLNGEIDAEGTARLEAMLAGDRALQRVYLGYVGMHAELATSDEAMQLSGWRERLASVMGATGEQVDAEAARAVHAGVDEAARVGSRRVWWGWGVGFAAALALLVSVGAWLTVAMEWRRGALRAAVATVEIGEHLEHSESGDRVSPGALVQRSTLRLREGEAKLQFSNGTRMKMNGPTLMRLDSDRATTLVSGAISARVPQQAIGFTVTTPSVHIVDLGTDFDVRVDDDGHTVVEVNEGVVVLRPRHRLPRFWWTFDEANVGPRVTDKVRGATGSLQKGATRVDGLIGGGAVRFDNQRGSGVNVGNGGGTSPGTGGFAVTTGVTVEAVIAPKWTGNRFDYDEIFRKDDGRHRILLSFQNDDGAGQATHPDDARGKGPTLSFGLYIDGHGYGELEALLDGEEGRPSLDALRDGKPHHVVASYDAQTGVKSLFIDGRRVAEQRLTAGAPIISGGPTNAFIGNVARGGEPFLGVIDEVAFYDYALTAEEVAAHHANMRRGERYFFSETRGALTFSDDTYVPVVTLRAGQRMRFHAVTGLPIDD